MKDIDIEIINANLDHIRELLDQNVEVNALYNLNEDGDTFLHWAAGFGKDPDVVKVLLQKSTHSAVNAKNNKGETPLHWAMMREDDKAPTLLNMLYYSGSKLNAQDNEGKSPLDYARSNKHVAQSRTLEHVVEHLKNWKEKKNLKNLYHLLNKTLPHVVKGDDHLLLKTLLDAGCNKSWRDENGNTLLHYATRYGQNDERVADLLIKEGADVNAQNRHGNTPLHFALMRQALDRPDFDGANGAFLDSILQIFYDSGANLKIENKSGDTPWTLACENELLNGTGDAVYFEPSKVWEEIKEEIIKKEEEEDLKKEAEESSATALAPGV